MDASTFLCAAGLVVSARFDDLRLDEDFYGASARTLLILLGSVIILLRNLARPKLATLIRGKRVLICGASMGIGEQLVYEHAKCGAKALVIASRSKDKLEAVASKARALAPSEITIDVCTADFGEESSAVKVVSHAVAALGGLDTVILNHVTTVPHTWGTWSGPEGLAAANGGKAGGEILRSIFAINTFSYMLIATAALPHLEATKGSLVVVSSAAGKLGLPKAPPPAAEPSAAPQSARPSLSAKRCARGSGVRVLGNQARAARLLRLAAPRAGAPLC